MSRAVQPKDLEELLQWIEAAQDRHPEARIEHVERIAESAKREERKGEGHV